MKRYTRWSSSRRLDTAEEPIVIAVFVRIWISSLMATLVVVASSVPVAGQCGTPGTGGTVPQLAIDSDLWSSAGTFSLTSGLPGAHWVVGADTNPGPLPQPIGTICLGFSPAFFLLFDSTSGSVPALDATGSVALPVAFGPGTQALLGTTYALQAFVLDPGALGGIAFSNGLEFSLKAPRVFVVNAQVAQRSLDVFDAYALTVNPAGAMIDSVTNQGLEECALSPDGSLLFTRDVTVGTPNRVRAFDATSVPATHLQDAQVSPNGVGGSRRGVVVDAGGVHGYFCDNGGVHRFDADSSSPTFMSITGFAPTTVNNLDSLDLSPDGGTLFAVSPSAPPIVPSIMMIIDTATMTETAVIPLSDMGAVLGMNQRGPVAVSPDGSVVATLSLGFHLPVLGTLSTAMLSIVDILPGPTQYTEIAAVPLPRAFQDDLAFDPRAPGGRVVYTVGSDQSTSDVYLTTVDWVSGSVSGTLLTTGSNGFIGEGGVGTTPDGAFIFVATSADDTLRVLDATTLSVIQTMGLPSNGVPSRVRVERRP